MSPVGPHSYSPSLPSLLTSLPSFPAPSAPPATLLTFSAAVVAALRAAASHRATQSCSCGGGRNSGGAEVYALCLIFHLFLSKGGALPDGPRSRTSCFMNKVERGSHLFISPVFSIIRLPTWNLLPTLVPSDSLLKQSSLCYVLYNGLGLAPKVGGGGVRARADGCGRSEDDEGTQGRTDANCPVLRRRRLRRAGVVSGVQNRSRL